MYSFSYLEPVCCSMSSSNCCFLTCIQVSQEEGQVVSLSVVSNSLWPYGLQHTRLRLPVPGACPNSCPLSQWYHPTISSSIIPFFSHLQSFPASESFPISQFFASGGQSVGLSPSAWVLPMNTQDWSSLGWTGWICCSPRESQESSLTPQFKSINSSVLCFLYSPTLTAIHDY